MTELENSLVDQITKSCINLYKKLPKTGKTIEKEWTVLSFVVKYEKPRNNIEVVSLGTGSKCIGATKMTPTGDVLNDSHAEVFARRGFLLYLYDNIRKNIQNEPSIFSFTDGIFKLKEGVDFMFYSSQLPCGDASIIPKSGDEEHFGEVIISKHESDTTCDIPCKKRKVDEDIHRTGAKCLPHSVQDPKEAGTNYHLPGQVRTKPGRGDRTLSVSCSDKMARWIHLGIQGSLLSLLCEPIYIKYFLFGAGVPYSEETLKRALFYRNVDCCYNLDVVPNFYQSTVSFENIRNEDNIRPAPGSILWVNYSEKQILEVAVQGKKLGVTKKKATSQKISLCISKYNLYKTFLSIISKDSKLRENIVGKADPFSVPYNEMKRKSKKYLENWSEVKEKVFKTWTVKPDIWNFCVDAT